MAAVTLDRFRRVHARVADALDRTGPSSVLPAAERNRLLADACGQVCDLLTDWLDSDYWTRLRPPSRGSRVADGFPAGRDYAAFLDATLSDALARAGMRLEGSERPGSGGRPEGDADAVTPTAQTVQRVQSAREAVSRVARRHRRWRQADLYAEASKRVGDLRDEACGQATALRALLIVLKAPDGGQAAAARGRAGTALRKALGALPALALPLVLSVTPAQMTASVQAWEHAAVQVVTTYLVAEHAAPELVIAPPELGGPEIDGPELGRT